MFRAVYALFALNAFALGSSVTSGFTTYFGGSKDDFAEQIAVDAAGNIYIAGASSSGDLPGPLASFSIAAPQPKTCFLSAVRSYDCTPEEGFIAKIAPDGSSVLYSAYLSGRIVGMALDPAGNLYVTGVNQNNNTTSSFLTEISAGGSAILYSTTLSVTPTALAVDAHGNVLIGTTDNNVIQYTLANSSQRVFTGTGPVSAIAVAPSGKIVVTGGSYVPVAATIDLESGAVTTELLLPASMPNASPYAIAVDASGNVYAAGVVNSSSGNAAFVSSVDSGSRYLTLLDGSASDAAAGIAVDASSRAYVAGYTTSPNFPGTPASPRVPSEGACTGVSAYGGPSFFPCGRGFLTQLNADGTVANSSLWAGEAQTTITAVALDPAGNVYVSGWSRSAALPTTNGVLQQSLAAGTCQSVYALLTAPGNTTLDSPCADAFIAKLASPGAPPKPVLVSSASYVAFPVAPGALVTLFGSGLGPQTGVVATPSPTTGFGTNLASVQVLFDGVAAPLLYAQDSQINAIVPFGITTEGRTHVQVVYNSATIDLGTFAVGPVSPGVFTLDATGSGQAAVVNQDNSINGPLHPAPKGTVISIYSTGGGQTNPQSSDGGVAGTSPPTLLNSVFAWFQTSDPLNPLVSGAVTYYGGAPALVNGVVQINVRVPDTAPSGNAVPIFVEIGGQPSQTGVTVAIQ